MTILQHFAISPLRPLLILTGIVLATGGTLPKAMAQSACQPPRSGEFLLLVVSPTPETQTRVRNLVARDADVSVCNYYGQVVTRIGGYQDAETASSWANYLNESVGLQAFVARPASGQTAQMPPTQVPQSTAPANPAIAGAFNPQRLGEGFAVIVNYYNRPELARSVQQTLNRNIGLASYEQRPYLLAVYSRDRRTAESISRILTERGFMAEVVDSRGITVLTQNISLPQAVGGQ